MPTTNGYYWIREGVGEPWILVTVFDVGSDDPSYIVHGWPMWYPCSKVVEWGPRVVPTSGG